MNSKNIRIKDDALLQNVKEGAYFFQTVKRGQEFVLSENDDVTKWAKDLILKYREN